MKKFHDELGVRNVLLLEDNPWTRDALSHFFEIEGCRLRAVDNATDAIIAVMENEFDLILCEYWLPDMDGLSFLKLFGGLQPGAVKVLMTAYPRDQAAAEAPQCGIHEVIRKPFTVEALETLLMRHFPRGRDREAVSGG